MFVNSEIYNYAVSTNTKRDKSHQQNLRLSQENPYDEEPSHPASFQNSHNDFSFKNTPAQRAQLKERISQDGPVGYEVYSHVREDTDGPIQASGDSHVHNMSAVNPTPKKQFLINKEKQRYQSVQRPPRGGATRVNQNQSVLIPYGDNSIRIDTESRDRSVNYKRTDATPERAKYRVVPKTYSQKKNLPPQQEVKIARKPSVPRVNRKKASEEGLHKTPNESDIGTVARKWPISKDKSSRNLSAQYGGQGKSISEVSDSIQRAHHNRGNCEDFDRE